MKYFAVIVAGGKGLRMKSETPKQFIEVHNKPVLMHTIDRFSNALHGGSRIILVLPQDQIEHWKALCVKHVFSTQHEVVTGGSTRFESVQNGITACPESGTVGIHDGVRPLVSTDLIQHCFETAAKYGSALPVLPIKQSLRSVTENGSKAISREGILAVQTPQCFELSLIKEAYKQPYKEEFTDDATVYESLGHQIKLVNGESTNIKLTTPEDLKIAEAILATADNG